MQKLEAVIFDWAGTIVDFGSFAPTSVFVAAFKKAYNFDISLVQARGPMGLGKWQHIRALGDNAEIAERWLAQFGRPLSDADVNCIYETFIPLQISNVKKHAQLIPGVKESLQFLTDNQIKVGSCSGYPRQIIDVLIPLAASNGYRPDCVVASDDLAAGSRPGPWMALQNVIELGVSSVANCVKVDDSAPGIYEGHNAGMWTVGLTLSGNEAGFTLDQFLAASDREKALARERAAVNLKAANAHYIIDTVADLPAVILQINQRLAKGERP